MCLSLNTVRFFKKARYFFLICLVFISFLNSSSVYSYAEQNSPGTDFNTGGTTNPSPTPDNTSVDSGNYNFGSKFSTQPTLDSITEKERYVDVTFHGLPPGAQYVLCNGWTGCIAGDNDNPVAVPIGALGGTWDILKKGIIAGVDSKVDNKGDFKVRVCGHGDTQLYVGSECDKNEHWFIPGNIYTFSIGIVDQNFTTYSPVIRAGFYVGREYPTVVMNPSEGLFKGVSVSAFITAALIPHGDNKDRNNYQVQMTGPGGYDKETCIDLQDTIIKEQRQSKTEVYSSLGPGKYVFSIREEVNEQSWSKAINQIGGGLIGGGTMGMLGGSNFVAESALIAGKINPWSVALGAGLGGGLAAYNYLKNDCIGGFVYYRIVCTVQQMTPNAKGGFCTKIQKDPNKEEYSSYLKSLNALTSADPGARIPCENGDPIGYPGNCDYINTAIGKIYTTPQGFIISIFRLVLTLAAFGSVIIIIYAGYSFILARGDKEKISGARETITSAILGLLFIVLSIVILQIIGVDVLQIPGFK